MLYLVKRETKRIDSRFLEPACGTGNFLVEILKRKLSIVDGKYHKNQLDLGKYEGTYSDEMLRKRWDITQDEWAFINSRIKDPVGKSDESYNE